MSERPGYLIVFEGIDGVGKSTMAGRLAATLRQRGHEVVQSREPTDGPWGQALRDSQKGQRLSPERELELFLLDRREHVETLIRPTLQRGGVVILDRYYFSTVAYQGARGFDPAQLLRDNEAFAPAPDLLLLLDMDPEEGLRRIRDDRGQALDSFEVPELLSRSRQIFLDLVEALPYAHRVDANQPPEDVEAEVMGQVDALMG